jgi:hypothetical protein
MKNAHSYMNLIMRSELERRPLSIINNRHHPARWTCKNVDKQALHAGYTRQVYAETAVADTPANLALNYALARCCSSAADTAAAAATMQRARPGAIRGNYVLPKQ